MVYRADGPVAHITINRPEKRNALAWDTVRGLRAAVADAGADAAVRVVVLTGAGEKAFCAGIDLTAVLGAEQPDRAAGSLELAALFQDLWSLGKPTIARVLGYALAGGFGLACACDLVVAADDAVFGAPEIDVGLWPFIASVPIVHSMAPKKALELMMTGRRVSAAEGERLGFVTRAVPAADLDAAVGGLATTLATKPPGAMRVGRRSFYATAGLPPADALAHLQSLLAAALASEEAAEGAAAFAERRPPLWSK